MTELELQQYLLREYPQENARCEWKEFKNLKNSFCGDEKDDVISYVSAIANMEGGFLVVGVHDKTMEIVGTDTYNYDRQKAILRSGFLYYANGGSFIPGSLQKALATHGPQRHYRNECLCNAMVNFNMIDIVGRGIRKIFNEQWKRHFPMPDYEIDAANKEVAVRLYGNAINEKYTRLLKENKDLSLEDCILLDAVQKGHRLSETDAKNLLERGLVEGEYPDLTISLSIARQTKQLPEYTKVKGLECDKIKQMALQFIQNAGEEGTKLDAILEYIKDVLPSTKSMEQKRRLLRHILEEMKNEDIIKVNGLLGLKMAIKAKLMAKL